MSHIDGKPKKTALVFSDATYDFFNNIVKLGLPGLGALYAAVAAIWGLPYAVEVVGTIAAIAVFLGILLVISKARWTKDPALGDGNLVVNTSSPYKDTYTLAMNVPLQEIAGKSQVILQVVPPASDVED